MNVTESDRSPDESGAVVTGPDRRQETPVVGTGQPGTGRAKFRLRKVLMVVVPVAVLAAVVVAVAGIIDVDVLLSDLTRPALAPAGGQVLFRGQPLLNGQIMTQPMAGRGLSAIGWTDDEGKFTLKTDIRGNYVDGATVGQHRVAVSARENISMPGGPPLLTPEQYASAGTSPLQITVGRNPDENQFKLILEGEPPSQPKRSTKAKAKAKAKSDVSDEQ